MKKVIMPDFTQTAGPVRAMNYPDGYTWPPLAVVREVFVQSGRTPGEYAVPGHGKVTITEKDGRLNWTYVGDNGVREVGTWAK